MGKVDLAAFSASIPDKPLCGYGGYGIPASDPTEKENRLSFI
jgi:hypothetical protein